MARSDNSSGRASFVFKRSLVKGFFVHRSHCFDRSSRRALTGRTETVNLRLDDGLNGANHLGHELDDGVLLRISGYTFLELSAEHLAHIRVDVDLTDPALHRATELVVGSAGTAMQAKVRRRITDLLSQPSYNITDYDQWARAYYPALRARVDAERVNRSKSGITPPDPLVSILVPTYRPLMSDFVAAIESVIAQTYSNWELVIVDDCSRQPELTKQINEFCIQDSNRGRLPGNQAVVAASRTRLGSGGMTVAPGTCRRSPR